MSTEDSIKEGTAVDITDIIREYCSSEESFELAKEMCDGIPRSVDSLNLRNTVASICIITEQRINPSYAKKLSGLGGKHENRR